MYPQRYSLILWANPKEETEAETAQLTYSLLKLLDGYGDGIEPRYIPGQRKSAVKPFELTFDNVVERLRASINEEGGRVFRDLGYVERHFARTQNKPSSIHWLNYFDEEVAEGIGRERLATLPTIEKLKAGYFYRLQSDLFDAEDPEQVRGQKEINIQLGLTTQG